jgi:hypothetical protein
MSDLTAQIMRDLVGGAVEPVGANDRTAVASEDK